MARYTALLNDVIAPLSAFVAFVGFSTYQVAASTGPMLNAVHAMS
jgi:hypothetical protein